MIFDEDQNKKENTSSIDSISIENKGFITDQSILNINGKNVARQKSIVITEDDDPIIQDVNFTKRNSITQQKNENDIFFATEIDPNY